MLSQRLWSNTTHRKIGVETATRLGREEQEEQRTKSIEASLGLPSGISIKKAQGKTARGVSTVEVGN